MPVTSHPNETALQTSYLAGEMVKGSGKIWKAPTIVAGG